MIQQFQKDGQLTMLAFDHRGSFKKMMEAGAGREVSLEEIIALKRRIVEATYRYSSGILIDQDYGLPAIQQLSIDVPYLLPMEKTGYTDQAGERITELGYSGADILKAGGKGAKLLLYTNPNVPSWATQLQTAKKAIAEAEGAELALFLEFVLYPVAETKPGLVSENVSKAIDAGIKPDVWKVAYPGSKEECARMSAEVGETPWILLTGGDPFETFRAQFAEAHAAGAKGFLAGRALWSEACALFDKPEELSAFLQTTLPERFQKLLDIAHS